MTDNLLPCPNPWGQDLDSHKIHLELNDDGLWCWACSCGIQGPKRLTQSKATEAWNRRAEVARLEREHEATKATALRILKDRDTLAERVRVLEAQANITDRLFLRVLSQALGEDDNRELHHLFMSAYEQACAWVECKGYGERTDIGARLKDDPFDAEVSWGEMDALAQPQPCKTCGGCGELVDGSGLFKGSGPTTEPCPDCQPQQKGGSDD